MAVKEHHVLANGEKPKKKLILNAFVEMCTFPKLTRILALSETLQVLATKVQDYGDIHKTVHLNSTPSATGSISPNC